MHSFQMVGCSRAMTETAVRMRVISAEHPNIQYYSGCQVAGLLFEDDNKTVTGDPGVIDL